MQGAPVQIVSVSCPTSGANADCSILVLQQFFGNHNVFLQYEDVVAFVRQRLADFGMQYNKDEQIGKDLFEGALLHFLPNYEIEFYNLVHKPKQEKMVTFSLINKGAAIKSQYRLILISSWDAARKTQGAGHFALLNTRLARPEQIVEALRTGNYTEERFRIAGKLECEHCGNLLMIKEARACGNSLDCKALYCNDKCARGHWNGPDQHGKKCK
jgi:hypothetical protein